MIQEIIEEFRKQLEDSFRNGPGPAQPDIPPDADYTPEVNFIRPANNESRLEPNSVNIVLFNSYQNSNLVGGIPYVETEPSENEIKLVRPTLKLTLNLLLIFNLHEYPNALKLYNETITHFYSNPILYVEIAGTPQATQDTPGEIIPVIPLKEVDVLLSTFTPREELEIWSNFSCSGLPILRYELNFADIQFEAEVDPTHIVRRISPSTSPADGELVETGG